MFLSELREFPSAPCLAGIKNLMTARVSMLLQSRVSLTCFRSCFLPGRAKNLPAPRQIFLDDNSLCNFSALYSNRCGRCTQRRKSVDPGYFYPNMYSDTHVRPPSALCLPACTHVATRETLKKFSRNFISASFNVITFNLSECCGTCIDGWVLAPCARKPYYRLLEGTCCLHLRGRSINICRHTLIFTEIRENNEGFI